MKPLTVSPSGEPAGRQALVLVRTAKDRHQVQLPQVLTAVPHGWQGACAWASPGFQVIIKDVDGNAGSNPITVQAHEGDTMDGERTLTIGEDYGFVRLVASEARRWAIL